MGFLCPNVIEGMAVRFEYIPPDVDACYILVI